MEEVGAEGGGVASVRVDDERSGIPNEKTPADDDDDEEEVEEETRVGEVVDNVSCACLITPLHNCLCNSISCNKESQ